MLSRQRGEAIPGTLFVRFAEIQIHIIAMNRILYVLFGAAVLGIVLLYCLTVPRGQTTQPLSFMVIFGGVLLAFWLASFLPNVVRRWRGLPPKFAPASKVILRYPFRSPEAKDICDHLTLDESCRWAAYWRKTGAITGIIIFLLIYPFVFSFQAFLGSYLPRPWSTVVLFCAVIPVGFLIGWISRAPFRNGAERILCETEYAKQMGFTLGNLRLYSFGRLRYALICAVVVPLLVGAAVVLLAMPKADAPFAIIARMAKVYANCKSYQDSGVVTTVFFEDRGNRTVAKPFTTAFVRPDRFRFEFRDKVGTKQTRYIICANRKERRTWWDVISSNSMEVQTWWDVKPGIEKPASLGLAVGGAAGVSGLSSKTIPALLLPNKLGGNLTVMTDPKRVEDGTLSKVECFRIEGKYGSQPFTVWIDKKSYLLRRIDERTAFDKFRTEQTTTYDPTINKNVAGRLLEFDPPVAGR